MTRQYGFTNPSRTWQSVASNAGYCATEPSQPSSSAGMSQGAMDKLKELGQLHDQGLLTDEEFASQKTQILGS